MGIRISVEDFGPIENADIELKPLTVFLGPSNSGKSYFATMVYGLVNAIQEMLPYFPFGMRRRPGPRRPHRAIGWDYSAEMPAEAVLDQLRNWAGRVHHGRDVDWQDLPEAARGIIRSQVERKLDGLNELLNDELANSHGTVSDLVRRNSETKKLKVRLESDQPSLFIELQMEAGESGLTVVGQDFDITRAKIPRSFVASIAAMLIDRPDDQSYPYAQVSNAQVAINELSGIGSAYAMQDLTRSFPPNCYYLPAARSGITQGHKVIAGTMVRQSPFAGLQRMDIPTLPGVVTDFMSHMLTMETAPNFPSTTDTEWVSRLSRVTTFLEERVLAGAVQIEQYSDTSYPEIYYEPFTGIGRFPFNRTSSMVSELAPFILFLKHIVGPGDLIILEEPESHLHPGIQNQMARAIARLVNTGVKVIITTHSDLFLGALNNLMKLSTANDITLQRLGREEEDRLRTDDVSAYQFALVDGMPGSAVQRLEITPDFGIDEVEFTKVIEQLYDESMVLQRGHNE